MKLSSFRRAFGTLTDIPADRVGQILALAEGMSDSDRDTFLRKITTIDEALRAHREELEEKAVALEQTVEGAWDALRTWDRKGSRSVEARERTTGLKKATRRISKKFS